MATHVGSLRRTARIASLLPLLAGCYLSHPIEGGSAAGADAGPVEPPLRPDAYVAMDAFAPVIDGGRDGGPASTDGGACAPGGPVISVRVEAITSDADVCRAGHVEGATLHGVDPAPDERGIRLRVDYCPSADADCRCDIVVSNVGADLADEVLIPLTDLTIDVSERSLRVTTGPTCMCLGCPCSYALVLDATDGLLSTAAPELSLSQGAPVCPEPAACESGTWRLHASVMGDGADVPAGEDRDVAGVVHVRSVRDVDIFGPCRRCDHCGSPEGAWVAWVRH